MAEGSTRGSRPSPDALLALADAESRGLPGKAFLSAYMEGLRERGEKPIRDWDASAK